MRDIAIFGKNKDPEGPGGLLIKNVTAAKYVSELLLEIHGRLDESVATIKERWPGEDEIYRRAIGKILYELYAEILNPLYLEHPTLKPAGWDLDA